MDTDAGDGWVPTVRAARRARVEAVFTAPLIARRYWYVFHKMIVPPTTGRFDGVFACRELTYHDAHLVDEFPRPQWRREVAAWLDEPETSLFVAFHAGRAVAYEFVSRRVPDEKPFRAIQLAGDEVWVRDTYALPGYRARGAIKALRAHRDSVMGPLGLCGTVTAVAENRPALLAATYDKLTWKVDGLDYHRVLTFGWTGVDRSVEARLEARLREALRRRRAAAAVAPSIEELEELPAAA